MNRNLPDSRWDPVAVRRALVLTVAVYAVLGVVLSVRPPAHLPPGITAVLAAFPPLIALVNALALTCLVAGWQAVRAGRIPVHRRFMVASAALISLFLVLYVTRVALGGTKAFPGPPAIRTYVYLPILAVHIVLSVASVPLVIYNLITGLTRRVPAVAGTRHRAIGRYAVALWSTSLALGIVVYLLLNVLY
jgi:putative membrane protein